MAVGVILLRHEKLCLEMQMQMQIVQASIIIGKTNRLIGLPYHPYDNNKVQLHANNNQFDYLLLLTFDITWCFIVKYKHSRI